MSSFHKFVPPSEIHAPHSFIFINASDRAACTELVASDLGKFAWQKDINAVFMLVNLEPIIWVPVGMIVTSGTDIDSPSTDVDNVISSTDVTLVQESKLTQNITMTAENKKVFLPSSLPSTGLKFIIANTGAYSFLLQDNNGSTYKIKPGMYYKLYYTSSNIWEVIKFDATVSLPFFKCESSAPYMTVGGVTTKLKILKINTTDILIAYVLPSTSVLYFKLFRLNADNVCVFVSQFTLNAIVEFDLIQITTTRFVVEHRQSSNMSYVHLVDVINDTISTLPLSPISVSSYDIYSCSVCKVTETTCLLARTGHTTTNGNHNGWFIEYYNCANDSFVKIQTFHNNFVASAEDFVLEGLCSTKALAYSPNRISLVSITPTTIVCDPTNTTTTKIFSPGYYSTITCARLSDSSALCVGLVNGYAEMFLVYEEDNAIYTTAPVAVSSRVVNSLNVEGLAFNKASIVYSLLTLSDLVTLNMTEDTYDGYTASSTPVALTGQEAYKAFDGSVGSMTTGGSYWSASFVTNAQLQLQLPEATAINKYAIDYGYTTSYTNAPKNWTFEGSNNGIDWTVLDTKTGITWTSALVKEYPINNTSPFLYYRLNITLINGGSTVIVSELKLYSVVDFGTYVQIIDINNRVISLKEEYNFLPSLTKSIAIHSTDSSSAFVAYQDLSLSGYAYVNKLNL